MATPVIMPRQGQSVESCILVEWLVSDGESVETGKPLASIETDKAVFEVESPAAGTVLELFFEAGDDIPVLTNIAALGEPGEDVTALRPGGDAPATAPAATPEPAAQASPAAAAEAAPAPAVTQAATEVGRTPISPRASALAAKLGIDTSTLTGTGPGGRIIERDVKKAPQPAATQAPTAAPAPAPTPTPAAAAPPLAPSPAPAAGGETIPISGVRKIIAERMHQSLATTAQLTLTRRFDASSLLEFRGKVKAADPKFGLPNVTLNDMIVCATARTLMSHPALNAHFLGDKIVRHAHVNMGIAMDTPRGLLVPVLRNAQELSLRQISEQIKPIGEAAQSGKIDPGMLTGGTFTITNMGMLGIEAFTPILNAPEVGILGVGGPRLEPIERDGEILHIKTIHLSLTIDHQATDGADGARFLQDLVGALENFVP